MKTTAAVSEAPGADFVLAEVELDEPRADEVRVRIVATGLCHTDLSVRDTLPAEMFPRVFGHEGAGVVEAVGADVTGIEVGDHVVASFRACRACANCTTLGVGYCTDTVALNYMGFRMDGSTTYTRDGAPLYGSFFGQSSFAQHAIAHADNLVVVDKSLDLTRLGPYGCAFQTGAGTVLNVLQPGADDSLVVYGVGAVGVAALAAARSLGVGTVVAVDLQPARLEVAAAHGAVCVNPGDLGETSVVDRVKELTGGGASHAVDTTGVAAVIKDAVAALRPRGELVVLGLGAPTFELDAVDIMMNGKVVRGSVEGDSDPQVTIPQLLDLAASGAFDVDSLITTYPFTEINAAAADVLAGKVVKPVLVW
ncbi:NAD(P)-dependent alcohol dehydrogenase [Nocardioides sp. AE5]|uniref:NAD(P)-dependent alcohol dehydrogenase n=1 Tax=Nocardioides sp. AE5 TaxID=2962573 RepID=UPI002880C3DD|nr:NAD(P)-dependent alcohol dehydrogenase [Nocardioides sp. AE5]MDT0202795.1 NAD(P)-dependent alcohol dehydrogenase [Nocardioides sp. AE5]